jgi:hypothetical protein
VYKKPHLDHREVRYHVDSFVVTDRVLLDDDVVYADGAWQVPQHEAALLEGRTCPYPPSDPRGPD